MRDLHAALAALRCWEASWRLGAREIGSGDDLIHRLIIDAAGHLGARSLLRDPRQVWRPVLGSPENLPRETAT